MTAFDSTGRLRSVRLFVRQVGARATALAAAFVVAQIAASAHLELDESHPVDEICAVCVAVAALGAGNVAAPLALDLVLDTPAAEAYIHAEPVSFCPGHRLARGPPQAS